jgi:hypothetical protein
MNTGEIKKKKADYVNLEKWSNENNKFYMLSEKLT